MKQFYLLLTACLCFAVTSFAQTRYWVGPSGGQWSDPTNWAATTLGAGGVSVPNSNSYNVVLDKTVSIEVDIPAFSLNSLTVTSPQVRLYTTTTGGSSEITLTSATAALYIDAAAILEDSAAAETDFGIRFANNAKGTVDGTWAFYGTPFNPGPPEGPGAPYIAFPGTGFSNLLTVTGTIIMGAEATMSNATPTYLNFDIDSRFELSRDGGSIPRATWHPSSTIALTGMVDISPSFSVPVAATGFGNVLIDCPHINDIMTLNLPQNLVIKGNLLVVNTNNQNLVLGNGAVVGAMNYIVEGYVEIGSGAYVTLAGREEANSYSLQIEGNMIIQDGGTFDLQSDVDPVTLPITLGVRGDIIAGASSVFTCSNTTVNTATELFVVELNGTANQQLSFGNGTIDNAGHQVVLRVNNSAGITLLSPVQVGKVSWNTANPGIITATGGNYLYVANSNSTDPLVMNGASATGYVNGALRRAVAGNQYFAFAVGSASSLRTVEIKPVDAAVSIYEAEYFTGAHGGSVQAPLKAVSSQEYWDISKVSGSDASVQLTLAGAVTGAAPTDTLVIAHYNGTAWTDVRDNELFPGNSTTGTLESKVMSSFSPFTIAYTAISALPIYLVNFTARQDDGNARLNWTITDNSTPRAFEVLRSTNGSNFTAIGTVQGEEWKLNYDFTDIKIPSGTVYYRLRMIDINGATELTKIVAVMNGTRGVLITSMMPTIVTDRSKLQISSSENTNIQLVVTDMHGRSVHRQVQAIARGNQEIWLNLGNLTSGAYQVTGYLQNGEKTTSIRFIKQ